jgi:hypothetical protein
MNIFVIILIYNTVIFFLIWINVWMLVVIFCYLFYNDLDLNLINSRLGINLYWNEYKF